MVKTIKTRKKYRRNKKQMGGDIPTIKDNTERLINILKKSLNCLYDKQKIDCVLNRIW